MLHSDIFTQTPNWLMSPQKYVKVYVCECVIRRIHFTVVGSREKERERERGREINREGGSLGGGGKVNVSGWQLLNNTQTKPHTSFLATKTEGS